jgi:hypothetical protein
VAHSQETRDNVRRLYIEGLPLNAAAITCGISYDTSRDWKKSAKRRGDDWDTARTAYSISDAGIDALNQQLVESFARQALTTMRELDLAAIPAADKVQLQASLADAYAKFSKAFSRINPTFSGLAIALDSLKIIVDYLRQHDPAALRALHPHIDEIGGLLGKRHEHS